MDTDRGISMIKNWLDGQLEQRPHTYFVLTGIAALAVSQIEMNPFADACKIVAGCCLAATLYVSSHS